MTGEKDIWDEKPKRLGTAHYQIISSYDADKMDSFHEDVKAHEVDLEQTIINLKVLVDILHPKADNWDKANSWDIGIALELKQKLEAIEIILNLHYVEGDMTEKEALDEICHLVFPESRPSSEVNPE